MHSKAGGGNSDRSKRELNDESYHVGKVWPFNDRLVGSTSINMYEGMELPISLKSCNGALVGDRLPMSVNTLAEEGNQIIREGPITDDKTLV